MSSCTGLFIVLDNSIVIPNCALCQQPLTVHPEARFFNGTSHPFPAPTTTVAPETSKPKTPSPERKDKMREYRRTYYLAHREEIKARNRDRYHQRKAELIAEQPS